MALFLSTFLNKIDKKGRVSVPATFRSALSNQHFQGIVLYPSLKHPSIEGSGMDRFEKIADITFETFTIYIAFQRRVI